MNPKKHKDLKKGIAEEVGIHENAVDDFVNFYYELLRKKLSELAYPKIYVDNLGTFVLRRQKLDKAIKRNKDILGNLEKQTYNGYEKSVAVKEKLKHLQETQKMYDEFLEKKKTKTRKNGI